jgi:hypothetical protein
MDLSSKDQQLFVVLIGAIGVPLALSMIATLILQPDWWNKTLAVLTLGSRHRHGPEIVEAIIYMANHPVHPRDPRTGFYCLNICMTSIKFQAPYGYTVVYPWRIDSCKRHVTRIGIIEYIRIYRAMSELSRRLARAADDEVIAGIVAQIVPKCVAESNIIDES